MLKQIDTLNKVYKNEISDDIDECFSTLCSYFKENIKLMADNFKPNKTKIYLNEFKNLRKMNMDSIKTSTFRQLDYDKDKKIEDVLNQNRVFQENFLPVHSSLKNKENKDPFRALSQSCLSALNIKTLLNKIISNERTGTTTNCQNTGQSNQSTIETLSTCNSVGTLLKENIENQEEVLKLVLIGTKGVGKSRLINNIMINPENSYYKNNNLKYDYNTTVGIDIKKKVISIFDKQVRVEFFDIDNNLLSKDLTKGIITQF